MGFAIFTHTTSIIPADYGITSKTPVTAIAVGGGGGGGGGGTSASKYSNMHLTGANGGDAGKAGGICSLVLDSGSISKSEFTSSGGPGGGGGGFGGGGGGGGGVNRMSSTRIFSTGGGGGGSGYMRTKTFAISDPFASLAITIGSAGRGGAGASSDDPKVAGDGTAGGTTSVGAYLSAPGGEGGKGGVEINYVSSYPNVSKGGTGASKGGDGGIPNAGYLSYYGSGGGGGGGGGYTLGVAFSFGDGGVGAGNLTIENDVIKGTLYSSGKSSGGGGGGSHYVEGVLTRGEGGPYGGGAGGAGGIYISVPENPTPTLSGNNLHLAEDAKDIFMGETVGTGVVILFW